MIRRLKYHEIDFEKYANCLENSAQRKYSAAKDFLDITSDKQWELLIYNDYEAVMPIPFVIKFRLKIVHNPMLCQQLGIFSEKDSVEINEKFLYYLEKNYLIRIYPFNDVNCFKSDLKKKKNYIIYPDSYEVIYSKYSPKRKRKLRSEPEILNDSEVKIISYNDAQEFIQSHLLGAEKEGDTVRFINIFKEFSRSGLVFFYAYHYQNKITNVIAIYSDEKTNALLGTFNDKNYVKISGASILIDQVIKENIEKKIFDFEGSELPNVEEFFRGFRPELKPFPIIESSKKDLLFKLLSPKYLLKFLLK
ncbi:hypothetical protein NZ698_04645 [Chryseobacterium sp. PBS4-4]|uniref:GNAT family N-acetyltransferase n=1 Tax=Chryseobacterium edaphi TaxID=2976532 RepID=A0ABT2W2N4_9FLAO|nr:hypothetical protein [Chryseobacterium edaphi]MCU7616477.1 hypothetical protein [Chryseobacterium edaphi]